MTKKVDVGLPNDDFFSEANEVRNNWWKTEKVGDRIRGTLIAVREQLNTLSNAMQKVYELRLPDGTYWNVGGKVGIDAQMRNVKVGQVVGFLFKETKPATKKGFNDLKIIKVYAGEMDEAFLAEKAKTEGGSDIATEAIPF